MSGWGIRLGLGQCLISSWFKEFSLIVIMRVLGGEFLMGANLVEEVSILLI